MARAAGKAKTRKAVAKRFKVTGSGKILRRKQGKRHILQKKTRKRKRALGKAALVSDALEFPVTQGDDLGAVLAFASVEGLAFIFTLDGEVGSGLGWIGDRLSVIGC